MQSAAPRPVDSTAIVRLEMVGSVAERSAGHGLYRPPFYGNLEPISEFAHDPADDTAGLLVLGMQWKALRLFSRVDG